MEVNSAQVIGRVGSLAVALGVGAAVFTGTGTAWATEESDGPSSAAGASVSEPASPTDAGGSSGKRGAAGDEDDADPDAEDSRDTIRKSQGSARCTLGFFLKVRFNPGQYARAGSFANVGSYCMNVSFEGFGPPEKVLALLQKMIQPEGSSSSRVFETVTGRAKLVHGADIVRRPLRSP